MTVNEMIYKTLTTKITKEPKYKEVLEALGYKLVKDHDWSTYDYWGIKMAEDNRVLVISKNRANERALFKTAKSVQTKDIKKVDFVNLIKTDRSATRRWNIQLPKTRIEMYKVAKENYKTHLNICDGVKREIVAKEDAFKKAKESLDEWEKRTTKAKEQLDEIIAEIKK